ncbi:hypothetical protein L596_000918 [Steinernema carpocapsae]|uniref:Uncharacterized protein n=1 Tax=Steinernema carpocapsae TaxID=34508 RepID=A0A4U8UJT2_STECR|nr:hypothetical protein L596_000918 [Steinernema carpocapsae]
MERFHYLCGAVTLLPLVTLLLAHWNISRNLPSGICACGLSFSRVIGAAVQGYVFYVVIIFVSLREAAWPSVPVCSAIGFVAAYVAGNLAATMFHYLTGLP